MRWASPDDHIEKERVGEGTQDSTGSYSDHVAEVADGHKHLENEELTICRQVVRRSRDHAYLSQTWSA